MSQNIKSVDQNSEAQISVPITEKRYKLNPENETKPRLHAFKFQTDFLPKAGVQQIATKAHTTARRWFIVNKNAQDQNVEFVRVLYRISDCENGHHFGNRCLAWCFTVNNLPVIETNRPTTIYTTAQHDQQFTISFKILLTVIYSLSEEIREITPFWKTVDCHDGSRCALKKIKQ